MADIVIARLLPAVLKDIRNKVNANQIVTSATTELQAGFMLGINHVLNILAQDFTIEAPKTNN